MTETEVGELMSSAVSEDDWNQKSVEVKRRCGGYPSFWYPLVIASGLASRIAAKWDGDADIHAVYVRPS